jgi:polygalacturonase
VPLPVDANTVRLYGTYTNPDGTPASGRLTFTPSVPVYSATTFTKIIPSPITVKLDDFGSFSIYVPATNDTDITPTGWTYSVTVALTGYTTTFSFAAPLGADIPLPGVVPSATVTPTYTYVKTINGVSADALGNVVAGPVLSSDYYTKIDVDALRLRSFADVKRYGAVGDGVTDDTTAINSAISAVEAAKGVVYFPPGTYRVGTFTGTGITRRAITAKAGVTLLGASRESVTIKIPAATGNYFAIITAATAGTNIDGFSLRKITFDHNTQNNVVASSATMVADVNIRATLVAYIGSRIVIEDCRFTNLDCVWQLATYGNDVTVRGCLFDGYVASGAYHDSSTIYSSGKRNSFRDNVFNGTLSANGSFCAIETHGGALVVSDNVINNFFNGMNITGIAVTDAIGISVGHNVLTNCSTGVVLWSSTTGNTSGWGLENVVVSGNSVSIDYDAWRPLANTCGGIQLDPTSNLGARNVKITDNIVQYKTFALTPTANDFRNAGISWYRPGTVTGVVDENVEITNNQVVGSVGAGIYIQPKSVMKALRIRGNTITNPATGGGAAYDQSNRVGIKVSAAQDSFAGLYLEDNLTVDNRATAVVTAGVDTANVSVAVTDGQYLDNVLQVADAASTAADFKQSAVTAASLRVRARGAAIGVQPRAGYYVGPQGSRTTAALTQSVEYSVPVYLAVGGVLSRLGCEITTGVASTTVRLGVRADSNGLPGALLLDAGTVDASAATASGIEITGLSLRLPPGLYWFTATGQGGAPTLRAQTGDQTPCLAPSLASAVGASTSSGYITTATVTGALPATYAASSRSGAVPRVVALIA